MSNSNGRQRPGFPPQRPAPANGHQYDPRYAQNEPHLSWPPENTQQPQHNGDWGYDHANGVQPQQDAHPDERGWQQPAQSRHVHPSHPQPGYPTGPSHQDHGQYEDHYARPDAYARSGGGQPEHPYADDPFAAQPQPQGYDNRGYSNPGPQGGQASPYAARFEAYVPPSVNGTRSPFPDDGYGAGGEEPSLRGSTHEDHWPSTQPPHGGYARADGGYYPQQEYRDDPAGVAQDPSAYGEQWADAGHAPGYPDGNYAQANAYGYPGDPYGEQVAPALGVGDQHVAVNEQYDEYDEEYEDEDDKPSGRKRMLVVVGALVGAVVIGAGLAYGYKMFGGGNASVSEGPPVVRGEQTANKARPDNPGGRQFSHTDSKVMQRISQDGRGSTASDGTRRVSTMMIGRDGQVVTPNKPSLPTVEASQQPVVSVPGLTVVDGFAGQRAAQRNAATAASAGGGPIVVRPPPQTANALSPVRPVSVTEAPKTQPAAVAPPAKSPPKVAVASPPPRASVPVAKTSPPTSTRSKTSSGGNGYVAVLASVPVSATSRLDALKTFADIQQNYGSVLANRTPDVREANLGEKGKYHRLMVGPPSSREAANTLCKQLKSAGYPSCWITSY